MLYHEVCSNYCSSYYTFMKIKLVFPETTEAPPTVEVDIIPRIGELVSWNNSLNFKVSHVVHEFTKEGSIQIVKVCLKKTTST
jgi:hypothetical protein